MNFELRKWKLSDVTDVAQYANNQKIAANLRNVFPYPYTKQDAETYVCSCVENAEVRQICRAIVAAVETVVKKTHVNPKRIQRTVRRHLEDVGIGTKSQQALKLQQEQTKKEHKIFGKEQKEAEQLRRFALKQQKKKEKHRGR